MLVLRNIADNPALPAVLAQMQPRTLARLLDRIGLNDAAEIVALVPARNLLRALDEAVWKSPRPGAAQKFDRAGFVSWLEVWIEVNEVFVAERLTAMSDEYLAMCLSSVLQVHGGISNGFTADLSEDATNTDFCEDSRQANCYAIYGPFLIRAAFEDDWEIVRAALDALWRHAPDHLVRVLASLASSESMLDSGSRRTSLNLDVAFERERHLERRGYVSQTGARAFLASISTTPTQELLMMSAYDNETHRFLAGIENQSNGKHPIEKGSDGAAEESVQTQNEATGLTSTAASQEQISALSQLLENESIVEPKPLKSLPSSKRQQRSVVLAELLHNLERENQEAFQQRTWELAYLATVLIAGSSLEGLPLRGGDARDAALATCNLAVEFIHSRRTALNLDREPGLIRLFLIGWQMLDTLRSRIVDAMKASLIDLESTKRVKAPWLRNEVQIGIRDLQDAVGRHHFADARDATTFLSIVFDATACREIAPLLDDLPHFAPASDKSRNESQSRWIESIADFDTINALLSNLSKESN